MNPLALPGPDPELPRSRAAARAGASGPWRRHLMLLATLAAAFVVGGCAAPAPRVVQADMVAQDHLFASSEEARAAHAAADNLFAMSEPMRRYAERVLHDPGAWRDRRQALIDALYFKGELKLAYDAEITRTATEAFDARAGNCLSLVLMTAAFARHLDLPFTFQRVLVDEEFNRNGDLFFVSGHVNIMLGRFGAPARADEPHWMTIDFLPQADLRGQRTRPLEEPTIAAMLLNNRAAEALARGRIDTAYWWARTALERDPQFTLAANTLAVVFQRVGQFDAAERALRFVLEREPQSTTAWANLERLLQAQGRTDEARAAAERLAQLEPHPPFHFFDQGRAALQRGDAAAARDLFLRELRQQPLQHEVHSWLAVAYASLGDAKRAAKHMALAADYSPSRQTREIYAAKAERLRNVRRQ